MADEQDPIAKAAKELKNRQACGPLGHVWDVGNNSRYWTPDVGTPCDCGRVVWGGGPPGSVPGPARATIPARDGTRYEVINKQGTLRRVGPKKGKR
jgi:hypothetical protein